MSDFAGTTLALQHYYDMTGVALKLPLLTLYHANEQPFGRRMAVWMETDPFSTPLPVSVRERLDAALLKNRAVHARPALRILDFGTGEGHGFVVTDAISGDTLQTWLSCRGPLTEWQFLRLAEQLTEIVQSAHDAGFYELCLTTQNIFITDEKRFDITTAPLGIGLRRAEILSIRDLPVVPDLVRHIPPWEFQTQPSSPSSDAPSDASNSIQDLDTHLDGHPVSCPTDGSEATANDEGRSLDADVYNVAAVLYEAISGQHPYFGSGRELCDAVAVMNTAAQDLATIASFPKPVCEAVMVILENPRPDALTGFLSTVTALFDEKSRSQARQAEKPYLEAPALNLSRKKTIRPGKGHSIFPPRAIALAIALMILTALVTHHWSSQRHPVDLFALPELLPTVAEGVDIVIPLPRGHENVTVYISSLADGSLIRLGTLPLIYRNQPPSSRLNFVLQSDDQNKPLKQLPVVVRDTPGLQIVSSDFDVLP